MQVPDPHCASCNGTFVEKVRCYALSGGLKPLQWLSSWRIPRTTRGIYDKDSETMTTLSGQRTSSVSTHLPFQDPTNLMWSQSACRVYYELVRSPQVRHDRLHDLHREASRQAARSDDATPSQAVRLDQVDR